MARPRADERGRPPRYSPAMLRRTAASRLAARPSAGRGAPPTRAPGSRRARGGPCLRPRFPAPAGDGDARTPPEATALACAILAAVLLLGAGLVRVRDVHVGRRGTRRRSKRPSARPSSRTRSNSLLLDDQGNTIGVAERAEPVPGAKRRRSRRSSRTRSSRSRTSASGPTAGSTCEAIARAFVHDIFHTGAVEGASTIEQQFVKLALQAQAHRTIFEKLREAALAYPPGAPVVQGKDPHRLSEHGLLRQRRLRDRVGRPDVLHARKAAAPPRTSASRTCGPGRRRCWRD